MKQATPETIQLWGGALSLDFANSVDRDDGDDHLAPERTDVLLDPGAVARWGRRVGVPAPRPGAAELERVRAMRESVYAVFAAIARGGRPPPADLALVASTYAAAAREGELRAADGAWRLDWPAEHPSRLRFAVALDAVALLGDRARLERLTRCPGRHCGWLFLNASGRRRWCSMSACGSREKMRRMYERRRGPTVRHSSG